MNTLLIIIYIDSIYNHLVLFFLPFFFFGERGKGGGVKKKWGPERKKGRPSGSFSLRSLGCLVHFLNGHIKFSGSCSFKDFMKEVCCIWKASPNRLYSEVFSLALNVLACSLPYRSAYCRVQ